MMQQPDNRAQQARQLYEAGEFGPAGHLYHELWDERGDAFSGGRYAYCLRKCGHAQAALTVARGVAERYPDDIYVQREVVWALYDAEIKPAKEHGDLNALLRAGQEILAMTNEALPVRLVSFAVIGVAKDKMKWSVVSDWSDHLDPQKLSTEPRQMGGRRVISEREQWYFAKVKSLVQLKRWSEARGLALEALAAFPRKRDFARWAAQALGGQGQITEALAELEKLANREQPEWYLLSDLAELKLQNGQAEDAFHTACRAALASGEDKAKVGLFLLIGRIALRMERFDIAARHAAISRLVRVSEGWSVPPDVASLEAEARSAAEKASGAHIDLPEDIPLLKAQCRQEWVRTVPTELRPTPGDKPRKRQQQPIIGADQSVRAGRIKTYIDDRGFGFIVPDDGGDDLFFHISNVRGIEKPREGLAVQYQIAEGRKGPNAVNIQPASEEQ